MQLANFIEFFLAQWLASYSISLIALESPTGQDGNVKHPNGDGEQG
jgi:hypothetical protein